MKTTTILLLIVALVISCGFSACQTLSDRIPLETKSKAERDIATLNANYQAQLKTKDEAISAARDEVTKARDTSDQAAANAFFALDKLFSTIPSPLRTDYIFHNFAEEGWAALGHKMPTYQAMMDISTRLAKDLDVAKTSLVDLQKEHDKALADNARLADNVKDKQDLVTRLDKDKEKLNSDHAAALKIDEDKLKAADDAVIAIEKKRADDSAAIQALKTKISEICAVIALLCVVAAIYLPVGRGLAITIGVIAGAGGSLIWIITGPEVLAGCGVALLVGIGYQLYQHHIADKGVKAFAGLLGEKPELVPAADEWASKYVTAKDGTVTTVPDTAVQALVKSKLIASDKV